MFGTLSTETKLANRNLPAMRIPLSLHSPVALCHRPATVSISLSSPVTLATPLLSLTGETLWFDLELISKLKKTCEEIFPVVDYAYVSIPTYIGGQIGFLLNSKNAETDFKVRGLVVAT